MSYFVNMGVDLVAETCWACGTAFAMTAGLHNLRKEDGKVFHCPNGCRLCYGEGEVARLEKALAKEKHLREQETASLRDTISDVRQDRDRVEASLRSTKGVVTRIKNRVANGVCPCCKRTFADLAAHMKGQHPKWSEAE